MELTHISRQTEAGKFFNAGSFPPFTAKQRQLARHRHV